MTTITKSLRLDNDLNKSINDYLEATGDSFNHFAIETMREKMEDLMDIKDYQQALKDDDGKRYSMKEVKDLLDL